MALTTKQFVQGIYVAYFGRAADPSGINYWTNQFNTGNLSFSGIASNFAQQSEAKANFSFFEKYFAQEPITTADYQQFVREVYQNLFDRDPATDEGDPEVEGDTALSYWVRQLEEGNVDPGAFIAQIIDTAIILDGDDAALLTAKVEVAEAMTDAAAAAGWTNQDAIIEFLQSAEATAIINNTTAENVEAQKQAAQEAVPPIPTPGETFTLTVGIDDITGTTGNDVFNAPIVEDDMTLSAGDLIDGGAGIDRLNAVLNDNVSGFSIDNVEQFFIRAVDGDPNIDMTDVTGAQQLWNDRSITGQTLTFENVQNQVVIGLNDVRGGTTIVDYQVANDITAQTIVANGTRALHEVNVDGDVDLTSTTINVTANSNIDLLDGFDGIRTLTLTGNSDLTLTSANDFANIRTVNASGLSTDLTLDISGQDIVTGAPRLQSVVTGIGDDNLTIAFEQLEARTAADSLSINLGSGENTLTVAGDLDNTEIGGLNFGRTAAANLTIDGVDTLAFAGDLDVSGDATLDTRGIDPSTLVFEGEVDGAGLLTLTGFSGNTIVFEDLVGFTSDVNLTAAGIEGDLTIVLEDEAFFGTITLAEVTDLTIDATETAALDLVYVDTLTAAKLETLTLNLGEGILEIDTALEMTNLTSIVVTGNEDSSLVIFDIGTGVEDLATIDLSAFEGTAAIDMSAADSLGQVLTIMIGEGNVFYAANAGESREIFNFVGDDIGTIEIGNFTIGTGGNADRLDLTAFGITDVSQLTIGGGPDATIDSALFDGTITLLGVNEANLTPFNFLVTA
ncbi:DUF4214 domain-containing protein [Desulfonatronum parangueonense]